MINDLNRPWKNEKIKGIFSMEVLKIATAGSVDDGKSTLIGRLLYDTGALPEDKLHIIEELSAQRGMDYIDYSLATDGLLAEREQGITIDVAHIYLSTDKRSYIIADTPGHEEFTRNMVTGASTSQLAIVLVDARKGVLEQTRRHIYINKLLRIKKIVIAVNKMDLVEYSQEKFEEIRDSILNFFDEGDFELPELQFIPMCALTGENVVASSRNMEWYNGPSLLAYLEETKPDDLEEKGVTRFPIQMAIRPKTEAFRDFRGYAGKVLGNSLALGDEVTVLPSGRKSKIKEIRFYQDLIEEVAPGSSVIVTLTDELQLNRGDMLVKSQEEPLNSKELTATVCWMDSKPLCERDQYLVQHHSNLVLSRIESITSILDTELSGKIIDADQLQLNDIGRVRIKLSKPIFSDTFAENKANGSFILIDPQTNATAGVGLVQKIT